MKLIELCKTLDNTGVFDDQDQIYLMHAHPSLIESIKQCDEFKDCSSLRIAKTTVFPVNTETGVPMPEDEDNKEPRSVVQVQTYKISTLAEEEFKLEGDCYVLSLVRSPRVLIPDTFETTHVFMVRVGELIK